jgi:hypothetical protein
MVLVPGFMASQTLSIVVLPGLPTGLELYPINSTSIEAEWLAPDDDGGAALSYDIRISEDETAWTETAGVTSPHVLTGLDPETEYFVQVRARNVAGVSDWTASASTTTLEPPAALAMVNFADQQEFWYSGNAIQLRRTTTTNARCATSWDVAGSAADVEVLARVTVSQLGARIGIHMRGAGAAGSETGIAFFVAQPSSGVNSLERGIVQYSSGTSSTRLSPVGPAVYVGARYWVRARLEGTTAQMKVWRDGVDEPIAWDSTASVTVTASGWIGLQIFDGLTSARLYCDYYAADMAGGTAPGIGETPGADQYVTTFDEADPLADWTNRFATTIERLIHTDADTQDDSETSRTVQPLAWVPRWGVVNRGWRYPTGFIGRAAQVGTANTTTWGNEYAPLGDLADAEAVTTFVVQNADQFVVRNRLIARGSRTATTGYVMEAILQDEDSVARVIRLSNGTFAAVVGSVPYTYALSDEITFKLRCEGTSIRAKVWKSADEAEPVGWQIDATDSNIATGWWGIGGSRNDTIVDQYSRFEVYET